MTRQHKNSIKELRKLDPRSILHIITLLKLIVLSSIKNSRIKSLEGVILVVVLANSIAYTLLNTLTILSKLTKHLSQQRAFQFTGNLLFPLMSLYSYITYCI